MSRKRSNPPPPRRSKKPPAPPALPPAPPQSSMVSLADILGNAMPNEHYAVKILTEIRDALGVGSKPMLSDLPEIIRRMRRDSERYSKLRKLNPNEFTELWREALRGRNFDAMVDVLL